MTDSVRVRRDRSRLSPLRRRSADPAVRCRSAPGGRGSPLTVELRGGHVAAVVVVVVHRELRRPDGEFCIRPPPIGSTMPAFGGAVRRAVRRMTLVERDAEVVAAIDHEAVVRPAALEAAAGTLVVAGRAPRTGSPHPGAGTRVYAGSGRPCWRRRTPCVDAWSAISTTAPSSRSSRLALQVPTVRQRGRPTGSPSEIDRVRSELLEIAEG